MNQNQEKHMKSNSVDSNGFKIYYETCGSGPAIVFLHSFLCDGTQFKNQISALNGFRIINIDLRGHGQSGECETSLTIQNLLEDVMAVLDNEDVQQAIWVGASMGGFIALRAAVYQPERVSGLVLIGTDAGEQVAFKKMQDVALKFALKTFGAKKMAALLVPHFLGKTTQKSNRFLFEEYRDLFARMRVQSICSVINAVMGRESLISKLTEIQCPTLILVGEEDSSMPVSISKRMMDGIPNSKMKIISKAGHLCMDEQPDATNAALILFVQRFIKETKVEGDEVSFL